MVHSSLIALLIEQPVPSPGEGKQEIKIIGKTRKARFFLIN